MTPIEQARAYIRSTLQVPALEHPSLSDEVRRKVKHSEVWLDKFDRIGDLLAYLKRFEADNADPTYKELNRLGLKTFEDIVVPFEEIFSLWASDCTRQSDFVIGESYNAYQILIFAKNYDTRAGGMFVLESGNKPTAVLIKATLSGGRYPNEWIQESQYLKYYLKSISGDFGEHFKPNAAILNDHAIPIMTFVRSTEADPFTYQGIFRYEDIERENDGSKWFKLRRSHQTEGVLADANFTAKIFSDETAASIRLEQAKRLARLALAPKKPEQMQVVSTAYQRNPDVVAEVLFRAEGLCGVCSKMAPFVKRLDGSPYLEVHHRTPLADGGDDTVENAIALCPNCHRKAHFG